MFVISGVGNVYPLFTLGHMVHIHRILAGNEAYEFRHTLLHTLLRILANLHSNITPNTPLSINTLTLPLLGNAFFMTRPTLAIGKNLSCIEHLYCCCTYL